NITTDPASAYGEYEYDYLMGGAAGGLKMVESRNAAGEEVAHITGTTPADQVGLSFTLDCTVTGKKDSTQTAVADQVSAEWG
ncbi:hypothetical protein ACXWP3_09455, partial [Streptococcus pyogenes]